MTTIKEKSVNGVNLAALHDTIKTIRTRPELGASTFRLSNQWIDQALNRSTVGDFFVAGEERKHKRTFVFENDEGEVLLGKDEGANPVEFILHALAGCIITTTVYHAAAHGINIKKLETTLEGDLDLRGLLAISSEVPSGYQDIRVSLKIESDASGEKLEKLKGFYKLSPVLGTLTRPAKIDVAVIHEPSAETC